MTSIASVLNTVADTAIYLFPHNAIAPTLLGGVGGWFMGVGPKMGLLQGVASGVAYSWVIKPAGKYIEQNSGEGKDQVHETTRIFLNVLGTVLEVAGPIFLTMLVGSKCIESVTPYLPSTISWVLSTEPTQEYTLFRGLLVGISPAVAQHVIGFLRSEKRH
jgi:hypothetical protein